MVDTPIGLLGQRALLLAQVDNDTESASVKIQRTKMVGMIAHLWERTKRKKIVTHTFVQVGY